MSEKSNSLQVSPGLSLTIHSSLISAPMPHLARRGSYPTALTSLPTATSASSSHPSTDYSLFLRKGLSTGLALSVVNSGSYKLRCNGTRLDRLKSHITKAISTFSQQDQQQQNQRKRASPRTPRPSISRKSQPRVPPANRPRTLSLPSRNQLQRRSPTRLGLRSQQSVKLKPPPASSTESSSRKRRLEGSGEGPILSVNESGIESDKRRRVSARISARTVAAAGVEKEEEGSSHQPVGFVECKST